MSGDASVGLLSLVIRHFAVVPDGARLLIKLAQVVKLLVLAAIQPDDRREVQKLRLRKLAAGARDLSENTTRIYKERLIMARMLGVCFRSVEKPEGNGQRDGVEKVRSQRNHDVNHSS